MDRELYRRRQRRRAIIGWSVGGLVVVLVALAAIFGSGEESNSAPEQNVFGAEMTSKQYEAIHKGEGEAKVLNALQTVGLQEDQVQGSELQTLFPPRPEHSICSYWTLSDAPEHLVRLCFSDPQGVLLQKSVAAAGANPATTTIA